MVLANPRIGGHDSIGIQIVVFTIGGLNPSVMCHSAVTEEIVPVVTELEPAGYSSVVVIGIVPIIWYQIQPLTYSFPFVK
jgi:hypothetical protein